MPITMSLSLARGLAAAALFCCVSAHANLVVNGDFETGDFWGWTTSLGTYSAVDGNAPQGGLYGAYFGSTPGTSVISQNLTTEVGKTYNVSFYLQNEVDLNGLAVPNSFQFDWGGATVLLLKDAQDFAFTKYEFLLVASSTSTALSFSFNQEPAFWDFDTVAADVVNAQIPEPSGFALAGLAGVLALVISGRRRRSSSSYIAAAGPSLG